MFVNNLTEAGETGVCKHIARERGTIFESAKCSYKLQWSIYNGHQIVNLIFLLSEHIYMYAWINYVQ